MGKIAEDFYTSMKTLLTAVSIIALAAIFLVLAGFYPVAIVDGTPIFERTRHKAEEASKNFTNSQARAHGGKPIDFSASENRELLLDIRRGTLLFLIEDAIIQKKGEEAIEGVETLSRERVIEAMRLSMDPAGAAKAVYGLSLSDFRDLVLTPQARRDVLQEALPEKNQDFDTWLRDAKKRSSVRLMFVPFKWSGEEIQ